MSEELTEDDVAEVIVLHKGAEQIDHERPLATAPRQPFCAHRRTELGAEARRVVCRDCGREVAAFDILHDMARDTERYIEHRREAHRLAGRALEELDRVRRLESNAKARVRTARSKAPPCNCDERQRGQGFGPWCAICGGIRP